MLTGKQVREARALLGWGRLNFSRRIPLTEPTLAVVESSDGPAWLSVEQESAIRRALEDAGVEFAGEAGSARLKAAP